MDSRRLLILAAAGLAASACAASARPPHPSPAPGAAPAPTATETAPAPARASASMAPIADPPAFARPPETRSPRRGSRAAAGRVAIAAANVAARETSRSQRFVGGVQVFAYDPGRVYEVWTAPLRVTTLTLAPGETIVSKAAGDTVRWQIGETASGQGDQQRAHVMIKPLQRGLETNLVLATSQRVYLLQLKSGPPESFNAAVTWDLDAVRPVASPPAKRPDATSRVVTPVGRLDGRFRIEPRGRRPAWTPVAVISDGAHTFLTFPPGLAAGEAPALFVVGPDGALQLVNYRQQDGLWVADRVFDAAELRLGDRHPQIVRILRISGGRS